MVKIKKQDVFDYYVLGRLGKIVVIFIKFYVLQRDFLLVYLLGVVEFCLKIVENREDVYKYISKGNFVVVILNGIVVLGLGNIGLEVLKLVMEGKGLFFKIFVDIDVFDIEIDVNDFEKFIQIVKVIVFMFGGINLEDIKVFEVFEIEWCLKEELDIFVMYDDQYGIVIIFLVVLFNVFEIVGKKIENVKILIFGVGVVVMLCV